MLLGPGFWTHEMCDSLRYSDREWMVEYTNSGFRRKVCDGRYKHGSHPLVSIFRATNLDEVIKEAREVK